MSYYDKKFTLISTNMQIINEEVTAIANFIQQIDARSQKGHVNLIIIGSDSFFAIAVLVGLGIHLFLKTNDK